MAAVYENIFLIWIGRLGDFIVSTPFIQALREKYPRAKITMLVTHKASTLTGLVPCIDNVLELPSFSKPALMFRFLKNFIFSGFDLCVDLNSSYSRLSGFLTLASGSPVRVSFEKFRSRWFYTDTVSPPREDEHMLERYRRLADFFQAPYKPVMKIIPGPENEKKAQRLLESMNLDKAKFLVAIHPGNFKKFHLRWPEEKYLELSRRILRLDKVQLVYIAGPGEEPHVARMLEQLPGAVKPAPVMPAAVMSAFLKRMNMLIVSGTGTLHLAAAVGTPTLALHCGYSYSCWRVMPGNGKTVTADNWKSCRGITVDDAWNVFSELLNDLRKPLTAG